MKNVRLLLFILMIGLLPSALKAWPGMPLPPLHVDGRNLVDNCGNNVSLHGVAITPSPWFNGCQYGSTSQYCTWDNYDVQGCLNYNNAVMDRLTDTSDGWYLNYIRLHIDPYWTNTPGSPIPENDISRFDFNRLVTYTDQVIVPLINHAAQRGLYVVLRPPGVCPEHIAVGDAYHNYLIQVWTYLSQHPALKNADHVMFELANEPVQILGTNGNWGSTGNEHFAALKNFFQPIVNLIRNNGANNMLWIPGTGWQSHYQGYVNYPITGGDIGYAVHIYPGYWGGVRNYSDFQAGWDTNVKPIADIAPIIVTETDWAPAGYGTFGTATTGTAGGNGFGANLNNILYNSGNVSWNVLAPDNLLDHGDPNGATAYGGDWQACAAPVKHWFREFGENNYMLPQSCSNPNPNPVALVNNGIYEIEFSNDANLVLDLQYGDDSNGAVLRPFGRNGAIAQQWIAIDAGNGNWRFISAASSSDRCVDLASASTSNGTDIRLWDNYGNTAQAWTVQDAGNGYYRILSSIDNNKGWDVPNCVMDGSESMQLWDHYGTGCQLFKFNYLGSSARRIDQQTESLQKSLSVYPNPTINGNLNISLGTEEDFDLKIFSIDGKQILVERLAGAMTHQLQTNLPKGIYILKVSGQGFEDSQRIVVQ
ncbi:RICIN domain-containing protein [Reichenbachiella sp. MSK19-1]|uniref:RICIN domain-containing protein n=1 Tax=Reichenbachiella sp. MSK19-1 TaxID=1897631 RepID=UPI000E6CB6C0|nr:RICIN domain-containing protein [Reichenbachiella sp. MSK19-1]RJE74514.1 carbohydrate-binding protein [Reichenbachiella sp. MSK19-1]